MDDESFLKMAYKRKFGKELDLKNPVTFNEKLFPDMRPVRKCVTLQSG